MTSLERTIARAGKHQAEPSAKVSTMPSGAVIWWHWNLLKQDWIPVVAKNWKEAKDKLDVLTHSNTDPRRAAQWKMS